MLAGRFYCAFLVCFFYISPLFAQQLKIFTWEKFISPTVLDNFQKKTGHTVKLYYYDSEVDRNAILINGKSKKYDLIIVDNITTHNYGKLGVFFPIASLPIPNLQYNGNKWRDSCGTYGVPYARGTLGIIHRSSVSKSKIDSWYDLLTPPPEHIGTTMMLKDDIDTIAIALLAQGKNPFTAKKSQLKSAYSLLSEQTKYLLKYGYPVTYLSEKRNKSELTLAATYSGDLTNIKKLSGQDDWEYIIPKEGTLYYVDCFTAPSGHRLKQATKDFLDYINTPEIAYKNAQDIWFTTTNNAALLMASDKYKHDKELFPNIQEQGHSRDYENIPTKDIILRNRITSLLGAKE